MFVLRLLCVAPYVGIRGSLRFVTTVKRCPLVKCVTLFSTEPPCKLSLVKRIGLNNSPAMRETTPYIRI